MIDFTRPISDSLARQQTVQARCVHPSRTFVEFKPEQIEQSVSDCFERQVRQNADRLAVKAGGQQLTYAELNQAANRLAHALLACRGAELEPVPMLLHKETPLIVGTLGILKAGKIRVPLAPSLPRDRLITILDDLPASVLLTNDENLALAEELAENRCRVINVDALDARLPTEDPGLSISPDACAQIFYTSGSTGEPKGVVQNHRNLLHAIMEGTNTVHICREDRISFLGNGQWGIFRALLNGAAVYPVDVKKEGLASLADWLMREEITILTAVVSTFRHFVATLTGKERFPHLRHLSLGSEPVYKSDVGLFKRYFSDDCVLVHSLGITEAGAFRRYWIDKRTEITDSLVPVGYASADAEVLLLDEDDRPVGGDRFGTEQVGEIAVKSRYFPLGYWRRPEQTAAAYLPDPEGSDARLYRTGDLGRMLPDGCLFHLGRKDFQVKIRGYRVEIGAVEQALLDLDGVREAAVVGREDLPGDRRLVAYLVPGGGRAPTVTELRRALAATLPDYMVPSVFVMLDALPYTGAGKVDRRSLPPPNRARPALEPAFVAPRTAVEALLAELWGNLLAVDTVGVHDSFLDLGGHSLLATRMLSRVQALFQVEVPLGAFFAAPTVAGLAETLQRHEPAPGRVAAVARLRRQIDVLSAAEIGALLESKKPMRETAPKR